MSTTLAPPPLQTQIVDRDVRGNFNGLVTKVWNTWLQSLSTRIQKSAAAVMAVVLTAQSASIGTTALVPVAAAGLYRVSYRFRVTTAAGTSSALQVTITTTDGGVVCPQSSPTYTGNLTDAPQSGSFLVRADASTPITYSTTYASVGSPMAYSLDLVVEQL